MKRKISLFLVCIMMMSFCFNSFTIQVEGAVDYVTATREVNPNIITPAEEAEVLLNITGKPPVSVVKPNDVILILDKSGSMQDDNRFSAMKESAKEFIDLIDFTKHNVGVVDFSSSSITNTKGLTNDATDLKNYISGISCNGGTETGYAIRQAMGLLGNKREEAQPVILLLTDGEANDTNDALKAAEEAKNAGIVFYTIALLGPTEDPTASAANQLMQNMATTANHHHFVLGSVGLIDIYRAIVEEIGISSAYDVVIKEEVAPGFEIVPGSYDDNIPKPTVDGNILTWDIKELKANTLNLKYKVRPKADTPAGKYNVATSSVITYKDYAGASQKYSIINKVLELKNFAPEITEVTPNTGHPRGGEKIVIKGKNFRTGAQVKINNGLCTDVVVVDGSTIEAVTPIGVQGIATLSVINDDKQTATAEYTYKANPEVTSLSPNTGKYVGGESVFIYGNYFMNGMKVKFDGVDSTVNYYNSTKVIVKAPAANKEGAVDVLLENPDGTSLLIPSGYTYEPQIIEKLEIYSLSKTSGPQAGGTRLNIYGKNIDNGAKIFFGDKEGTLVLYNNSGNLLVDTPAQDKEGVVDVTIENLDGTRVTLTGAFEYLPYPTPEVTSITPATGKAEGGENVVINGANFDRDVKVFFGENQASSTTYITSQQLKVTTPAGTEGLVDVKVVNSTGKELVVTNGYEYLAPVPIIPEIIDITPNTGELVGGELAYITGKNFVNGTDFKVLIGSNEATVTNFYDAGKIRVRIPANTTPGKYNVTILNGDGKSATLTEGYEYLAPPPPPPVTLTNITPNSGTTEGGTLVYIEGTNFVNGPDLSVEVGGNKATITNFYGTTKIRVKMPANATAGKYDVVLTNGNGLTATITEGFEYIAPPPAPAPEITGLSLTQGYETGGDLVYVEGTNFQSGCTVTVGGKDAQVTAFYGSTKIRIRIPEGTPGDAQVIVTNPDLQSSKASVKFTYLEYIGEITSLSLTEGKFEGGELLYINGVNFKSGLQVFFGDTEAEVLNYYSSTKIRVRVPAAKAEGSVTVKVVNPDGKVITKENAYTYQPIPAVPAPQINFFAVSGTTPITTAKKSGLFYVYGSGFESTSTYDILDESGTVIYGDIKPYNFYTSLKLRFRMPSDIPVGNYKIVIKNVDGQKSNEMPIEIIP